MNCTVEECIALDVFEAELAEEDRRVGEWGPDDAASSPEPILRDRDGNPVEVGETWSLKTKCQAAALSVFGVVSWWVLVVELEVLG